MLVMSENKKLPEGITIHRDGAVSLGGPFGPIGIVGFVLPEGGYYTMHGPDRARLLVHGTGQPFGPLKIRREAVLKMLMLSGYSLDHLPAKPADPDPKLESMRRVRDLILSAANALGLGRGIETQAALTKAVNELEVHLGGAV